MSGSIPKFMDAVKTMLRLKFIAIKCLFFEKKDFKTITESFA